MGDDSQVLAVGRGYVKSLHGEFKNVLYVPSLAEKMLYIYQMTHTGSPNRVTFDFDTVEITESSTGNIIAKGFANHDSNEYEFSHFFPS